MLVRRLATIPVAGRPDAVRTAAGRLVECARTAGLSLAVSSLFEVAVVEAITNALEHTPRTSEGLRCELDVEGQRLIVRVLDEAAAVPPAIVVPAGVSPWGDTAQPALDTIPESGYGLYLMKAVFSEIRAVTSDGLHGIEMVRCLERDL